MSDKTKHNQAPDWFRMVFVCKTEIKQEITREIPSPAIQAIRGDSIIVFSIVFEINRKSGSGPRRGFSLGGFNFLTNGFLGRVTRPNTIRLPIGSAWYLYERPKLNRKSPEKAQAWRSKHSVRPVLNPWVTIVWGLFLLLFYLFAPLV